MDLSCLHFSCTALFDGFCSFEFPLDPLLFTATGIQKIRYDEQFCDKETPRV